MNIDAIRHIAKSMHEAGVTDHGIARAIGSMLPKTADGEAQYDAPRRYKFRLEIINGDVIEKQAA